MRQNGEFDFDDLMDHLYKGTDNFEHKKTRTQIRNLYKAGTSGKSVMPAQSPAFITDFLTRLQWDAGLTAKGNRVDLLDHIDTTRKSLIMITNSNGDNLSVAFGRILRAWFLDKDFQDTLLENKITKIDVAGRIYRPTGNVAGLNIERKKFYNRCKEWDTVFRKVGIPLTLNKCAMPRQLRSGQDKDHIW